MITIIGLNEKARTFSWQDDFPETAICICGGEGRLAFVAYEGSKEENYVCQMHGNAPGDMWPHDAIAVATYICKDCMKPIAILNQG